jgi:hypothetical protein
MLVGEHYGIDDNYGMFGLGQIPNENYGMFGLGQTPAVKSYLNFLVQRSDRPGMPPVAGAAITIVGPDDQSYSAVTDDGGMARFELPLAPNTEVRYKVEASGFDDFFASAMTAGDPQAGLQTVILKRAHKTVPAVAIAGALLIAGTIVGNALLKKY